jgi:hypothetical protein
MAVIHGPVQKALLENYIVIPRSAKVSLTFFFNNYDNYDWVELDGIM